MISTVVFILGAYGCYALYTVSYQRQGRRPQGLHGRSKTTWLLRAAGGLGLAGLLGFLIWNSSHSREHQVKLATIMGITGTESMAPSRAGGSLEQIPLNLSQPGGRPAYALLHPETPAVQIPPPKKVGPAKPFGKGKLAAGPAPRAPKPKAVSKSSKKDKAPGKTRLKKKHSAPIPRGTAAVRMAYSG